MTRGVTGFEDPAHAPSVSTTPSAARAGRMPKENRTTAKDSTMTTTHEAPTIDVDKLMAFVFKAVDEVGATLNTALVVLGDKLGYYQAMADSGPTTASRLAQ